MASQVDNIGILLWFLLSTFFFVSALLFCFWSLLSIVATVYFSKNSTFKYF